MQTKQGLCSTAKQWGLAGGQVPPTQGPGRRHSPIPQPRGPPEGTVSPLPRGPTGGAVSPRQQPAWAAMAVPFSATRSSRQIAFPVQSQGEGRSLQDRSDI